jgi:hypothetical protein
MGEGSRVRAVQCSVENKVTLGKLRKASLNLGEFLFETTVYARGGGNRF